MASDTHKFRSMTSHHEWIVLAALIYYFPAPITEFRLLDITMKVGSEIFLENRDHFRQSHIPAKFLAETGDTFIKNATGHDVRVPGKREAIFYII